MKDNFDQDLDLVRIPPKNYFSPHQVVHPIFVVLCHSLKKGSVAAIKHQRF